MSEPASIEVRIWHPDDLDPAKALIGRLPEHERQHADALLFDADQMGVCVVARADDAVVGVATLSENWLHPANWRLGVFVDPASRRQGAGGALMVALERWRSERPHRAVQVGISTGNVAGSAFLDRYGFRTLMTTKLGLLEPNAITGAVLADLAGPSGESVGHTIRLEPSDDGPLLVRLHERVYREQHGWSPVGPLTPADAELVFMNERDVIPGAMVVAWLGERPVGVASLRALTDEGDTDLCWLGAVNVPAPLRRPIVRALVRWCLALARERGWTVRVEVDRADPDLRSTLASLLAAWEPDWLNMASERLVPRPS